MTNFATLEPQDVRTYWSHEERDFTPWVADEINAEGVSNLEKVLGLDLVVIEQERALESTKSISLAVLSMMDARSSLKTSSKPLTMIT